MTAYIALLMEVLDIEFTVGVTTVTMGTILAASLIIGAAVAFFRKLGGRR